MSTENPPTAGGPMSKDQVKNPSTAHGGGGQCLLRIHRESPLQGDNVYRSGQGKIIISTHRMVERVCTSLVILGVKDGIRKQRVMLFYEDQNIKQRTLYETKNVCRFIVKVAADQYCTMIRCIFNLQQIWFVLKKIGSLNLNDNLFTNSHAMYNKNQILNHYNYINFKCPRASHLGHD